MIRYGDCTAVIRGLFPLWTMFVELGLITNTVRLFMQRRKAGALTGSILLIACIHVFWQLFNTEIKRLNKPIPGGFLSSVPVLFLIVVLVLLTVLTISLNRRSLLWQRNNISAMSVKEALDTLPAGICFYDKNGRTWMINQRMEELSRALTGKPLHDGKRFWEALMAGAVVEGNQTLQLSDPLIFRLADGQIIRFTRYRNEHQKLWEINATDITDAYRKTEELREKNAQLQTQRERLRNFGQQVNRVTREKEILATKAGIHDRMNRLLLTTLHYLEDGGSPEDREKMYELWRSNLFLMEEDDKEGELNPEQELEEAAESIGLKLDFQGEIPKSPEKVLLLMIAAGECMTNAIRHAGAERMCIRSSENSLIFSNDGRLPEGPIREGGGLQYIRRKTEELGGTMELAIRPVFSLQIHFPEMSGEREGHV